MNSMIKDLLVTFLREEKSLEVLAKEVSSHLHKLTGLEVTITAVVNEEKGDIVFTWLNTPKSNLDLPEWKRVGYQESDESVHWNVRNTKGALVRSFLSGEEAYSFVAEQEYPEAYSVVPSLRKSK